MIMELTTNGYPDVNIRLGYRSYSKQRLYYDNTVKDYMKTMSEEQAKVAAASVAQAAGANIQTHGTAVDHNAQLLHVRRPLPAALAVGMAHVVAGHQALFAHFTKLAHCCIAPPSKDVYYIKTN
jgi:hypothetical protein